jgi:hypothetical protein
MSQAPPPPATVGMAPTNSMEVNNLIGTHLRSFVSIKNTVGQDREWLAAADLKIEPYFFSAEQETLIKSAVADLDAALDAVDMTFINRLIGLY